MEKWINFKICLIFVKIKADQMSFLADFSKFLITNLQDYFFMGCMTLQLEKSSKEKS